MTTNHTTDIVERLRSRYMDTKNMLPCKLEHEAADELTRLRAENAELRAEREAMAKLEDALKIAEAFVDRHSEPWYISGQQDLTTIRAALAEVAAIRKGQA